MWVSVRGLFAPSRPAVSLTDRGQFGDFHLLTLCLELINGLGKQGVSVAHWVSPLVVNNANIGHYGGYVKGLGDE